MTLYYCDSARQLGIEPDVVMIIPGDTPFTSVELTALFGNLMENAVEALAREIANGADPKTLVFRVHATQQGKKPFVITVDNSCSQKTERSPEGMLMSTKHAGSGTGTESIASIARRHNSSAKFECVDGVFQTSIILSMPSSTSA